MQIWHNFVAFFVKNKVTYHLNFGRGLPLTLHLKLTSSPSVDSSSTILSLISGGIISSEKSHIIAYY